MKKGDRVAFMPIPTSTLAMVTEKDRRFHSASKMAQGIVSYSTALHDLAAFFHAVKTGSARPNSQPVSAWARAWGWDWRKALRFISVVMNDFFELDEKMKKMKELRERLSKATDTQKTKMKNYVRKMRGQGQTDEKDDDESEDERLFLDAMSALAKTDEAGYRLVIKKNLRNNDVRTVQNFENWLEKNRKKEISEQEVMRALTTLVINGHSIISYSSLPNGKYMVEFDDGFRTPMTAEAIVGNAQ